MRPAEIVKRLRADGWIELRGKKTSHKQFKHPTKLGKVTVAMHPGDVNPSVLKSVEKQSGVSIA